MTRFTFDHFNAVLEEVSKIVTKGKGIERHGQGCDFNDQPWRIISDNVGDGFVLGQAMKKIMELTVMDPINYPLEKKYDTLLRWNKEILGAISYLVFAYLYKQEETSWASEYESVPKE